MLGDTWDAVIDVSRQPGQVRRATAALAERTAAYVFISSGNPYADHTIPGSDETAKLLAPLTGDVMEPKPDPPINGRRRSDVPE